LTIPTNAIATEVPYVFGLSKADALAKISGRGLKTGAIKYQYSASVADGNVIDQNPVYWSAVAAGAPVNLVVSSSTPKVDEVVNVAASRCASSTPSDIRFIASAHSIDFSVPNLDKAANLRLDLFTLQGKYVQTIFNMKTFGGKFSVPFGQKNARLESAEVYCAVLQYGDVRKVLPVRFMKH
jgi:hypothetical protein